MAEPCCQDYQKSKLAKCMICEQIAQIIPALGLCQTCTMGEASNPMEVWTVHSLDCARLRRKANG